MTAAERLGNQIRRTITGPMWHGPSLGDLLEEMTPTDAARRPIEGAHSIWEIVLHIAVWADVALARLTGDTAGMQPVEDWPAVLAATPQAWDDAIAKLRASYDRLADAVAGLDEAVLRVPVSVPGQRHSVEIMLHGVVEHGTYHGGQVAILRRALGISTNA